MLWIDQSYGIFSSHVWRWELDHKKGWVLKNWCFRTVVLEKTFESPLDCKEIKPISPKGNQSWIFIGRTNAEAPTFWQRDDSLEKTLMLGKIEGKSRRRQQRIRWLDSVADSTDMNLSKSPEIGNGTPLQYSCLRNPMGGGAWWAAVYGVAQSRTRLKWLSSSSTW